MILIMFILVILFAAGMLFLGYTQYSFGLAYLGMFAILLTGLFLFSGGLQIESGVAETPLGSGTFLTLYENHTTVNDPVVNLLANTLFYIPIGGILLTTFIAVRG
jgi:hypothetical protein